MGHLVAKLAEHLQVVSLSPTKGVEVTLKIKRNCLKQKRRKEECVRMCAYVYIEKVLLTSKKQPAFRTLNSVSCGCYLMPT